MASLAALFGATQGRFDHAGGVSAHQTTEYRSTGTGETHADAGKDAGKKDDGTVIDAEVVDEKKK